MSSAFFGLNTAVRALMAQQQAIDTINHNVANANTEGYSRQRVDLVTTVPYSMPNMIQSMAGGQVGTGVEVKTTERLRDAFMDYQWRYQTSEQSKWQASSDALQQVEVVYNEPSDSSLSNALSSYWQAWQDLSNDPSSAALRANLRETGVSLSSMFTRTYQQLKDVHNDVNQQVSLQVTELNSVATQIADLNLQIKQVQFTGAQANDLKDKRDLLLDEVAKLTNMTYQEDASGVVTVSIGGRALVDGTGAHAVQVQADADGNNSVVWASDSTAVGITSGQLKGLMDTRDTDIQGQIDTLNTLASTLIQQVNTQHEAGYGSDGSTGNDFFSGTDASNIALSAAVQNDVAKIAVSDTPAQAGNGKNALAISALGDKSVTIGTQTMSIDDYYQSMITQLGVQSKGAQQMADNQQLVVQHLESQRQSVSGVSLDEEVTDLIRYQHAYQAAARVLTVQDELLDKLVNGTGVVGR